MERRSDFVLYGTPETPWQFICRHKRYAATGLALGLAAGGGTKYLAAFLLILWLLTGGH